MRRDPARRKPRAVGDGSMPSSGCAASAAATGSAWRCCARPASYAADRLPLERLRRGDPVLAADDDVHTNHIHADDLARIACLALFRALPGRAYNASDDSAMRMGDYFDAVADRFDLLRPPRVARAQIAEKLSPLTLSFMSESRRLDNRRLKRELRLRLRYPTVSDGLRAVTAG